MGFWKNIFGGDKKDEPASASPQTLADIARGMQHAVNSTQVVVERHFLRMFDRYFDDDGKAKIQRFDLPDGTFMEVPLIALVKRDGLGLEEMEIEMSVRIDHLEGKSAEPKGEPADVTRTSFQCSFTAAKAANGENHQNVVDISMRFKRGDPPEGVARLVEYYANLALPKKSQKPPSQQPPEAPKPDEPRTGGMPDMKVPPVPQ